MSGTKDSTFKFSVWPFKVYFGGALFNLAINCGCQNTFKGSSPFSESLRMSEYENPRVMNKFVRRIFPSRQNSNLSFEGEAVTESESLSI